MLIFTIALVPANESEEKIKKYEKMWIKIRSLIRSINKNLNDCDEKYIKIKFDSDDELPLNKKVEIPIFTIAVRTVFFLKR